MLSDSVSYYDFVTSGRCYVCRESESDGGRRYTLYRLSAGTRYAAATDEVLSADTAEEFDLKCAVLGLRRGEEIITDYMPERLRRDLLFDMI